MININMWHVQLVDIGFINTSNGWEGVHILNHCEWHGILFVAEIRLRTSWIKTDRPSEKERLIFHFAYFSWNIPYLLCQPVISLARGSKVMQYTMLMTVYGIIGISCWDWIHHIPGPYSHKKKTDITCKTRPMIVSFRVFYTGYFTWKRSWKLKRSTSPPTEALLSYRKRCSWSAWDASSVVTPLNLWLCDTLRQHVTHLHTLCLVQWKDQPGCSGVAVSGAGSGICQRTNQSRLKETGAETVYFRQRGEYSDVALDNMTKLVCVLEH